MQEDAVNEEQKDPNEAAPEDDPNTIARQEGENVNDVAANGILNEEAKVQGQDTNPE